MQTIPGTMMSDEPYTLSAAQIHALNSMPPGLYLVCSQCRRFNPASTTIHFDGGGMICDPCVKGVPMDIPMLVQCTARESGGVQCEVMLASPDEPHHHWISEGTINRG